MEPILKADYKKRVAPALLEKLSLANVHEIPRIEKVVINCCMGKEADRKQAIEDAVAELATISGQKPVITKAKKSVANFKLRAGEQLGTMVTLRGDKMYEFLLRFIRMAIPRIRDFRGVSPKSFDGRGNYTIGVSDQTIFPEIELDKVKRNIGFDVTIVTSARTDDEARALLKEMGMPFREQKSEQSSEAA